MPRTINYQGKELTMIDINRIPKSTEREILIANFYVGDDAVYNEELNLFVHPDGSCYRPYTKMKHTTGSDAIRKGKRVSFTSNGNGYKILNVVIPGSTKYKCYTQHRIVYSTFKKLPYFGDYTVGHFDDDAHNNHISNLYGIFSAKQSKDNLEHKRRAYKLLEIYHTNGLWDEKGNRIDIGDLSKIYE